MYLCKVRVTHPIYVVSGSQSSLAGKQSKRICVNVICDKRIRDRQVVLISFEGRTFFRNGFCLFVCFPNNRLSGIATEHFFGG